MENIYIYIYIYNNNNIYIYIYVYIYIYIYNAKKCFKLFTVLLLSFFCVAYITHKIMPL